MKTEKGNTERSLAAHLNRINQCSVCGRKITAPQKILSMDGIGYCDACYRDSFFADMESHRGQILDHCNA